MRSSRPARAVTMITGMWRVVNEPRRRLQTSTPSIPGIMTSRTMRSGTWSWAVDTASEPFAASSTV